jgi:transposase InsO family protein
LRSDNGKRTYIITARRMISGLVLNHLKGPDLDMAKRYPATCPASSQVSLTVPIHTILTDNGIQFADQPRNRNTAYSRQMRFDMICEANEIEHRLTRPNHPWTNGQVERMNRTIKDATVKRFHYESHDQLRAHLADFMAAYNFARRLKTLGGLTAYEYICKIWTSEPNRFIVDPIHQMPGLNT